jgi:phage terminase small subunit
MGRNAKPISLHLLEGNPNRLTKAQIEARKEAEIHLGDSRLRAPQFVKKDIVAYSKWKECVKIFEDVELVTSADVGHLARYCKTFSEYLNLLSHRDQIQGMEPFDDDQESLILDEFEEKKGARWAKKTWQKINYLMSLGGLLSIDKAINAKLAALNAMEDRLFLHPLARVKNVPKKEKKAPEDPNAVMFGD